MDKYLRVTIGMLAGIALGYAAYAIIGGRRKKTLAMPGVRRGKIIQMHSARPPYGEAAESAVEYEADL